MIVEDDDKGCDLEGIMIDKDVEASGLRDKMRALQEKCRFASVVVSADMLAVIELAEQGLDSKRQVTKWK